MKRAFTLVELIVVIVILGILATIATEILLKVYKNYVITKSTNALVFKTDIVLNTLAAKLENRVKNSVIATECNATKNECINGNISDFISIQQINENNADKYPVMEWISKDIYSKRGEWDENLKRVVPGWSEFVDLKDTYKFQNDEYNITIPYSRLSIVQEIDGNFTESWGIDGYDNVFENNLSVIIFSGSNGRGAFNDINHSYGWYKVKYPNNKAQKIFAIIDKNQNIIKIKTIDDTNDTTVYEGAFLINTAFAIVPSYNQDTKDYNLTLFFNYFPWKKQKYTDGNSSLMATHITQFKFKEQNGLLRLFLCIQDPNVKINEHENLTICKERIVF